ncbi:uncharacterized protein LOC126666107 [Mercurialis annua]|uniref:uncharacterized protein LOC126666107 n=1 Tax=Mercurialis annua TaxID=3986 RepID=UPI002160B056|nr:uncharacterized protein LOC126666107 [Mercurialis annua]
MTSAFLLRILESLMILRAQRTSQVKKFTFLNGKRVQVVGSLATRHQGRTDDLKRLTCGPLLVQYLVDPRMTLLFLVFSGMSLLGYGMGRTEACCSVRLDMEL